MTHTHSPRAEMFAETFKNTLFDDLIAVQAVYVADYHREIALGRTELAQRILERNVNPMGEAIDMRDGTCRECAEARI